MTFRDDHDAALARAEALQNEVERERERADEKASEAAKLRRERDELAEKVARLERGTKVGPKRAPPEATIGVSKPYKSADGEREMLYLSLTILGLFVLVAIMAMNE
ncbi:MAG: hypothetical protein H0T46_21535 [Deltaproteobacteria bacterium]|nr:hypothetical protein [Deltaproteobacteria bacterium]